MFINFFMFVDLLMMMIHKEARDFPGMTHHLVAVIAYYYCVVSLANLNRH